MKTPSVQRARRNILVLPLSHFIAVNSTTEVLFTPGGGGIVGMALTTLAGLWLYRWRTAPSKASRG